MARSYHVDIARHAASADAKWIDNLLSHFAVPGVVGGRQGESRRLSAFGVYQIALIRRLTQELGISSADAVLLAGQLLDANAGHVAIGAALELRLDRPAFHREIDAAIAEAVESVAPARRGRPPTRFK
jgi:hypothetical protein